MERFKNVLTQSFKSIDHQFALRTKITKIKQTGTVEKYINDFDKIISHINKKSEKIVSNTMDKWFKYSDDF
jgi:hypothetical protein